MPLIAPVNLGAFGLGALLNVLLRASIYPPWAKWISHIVRYNCNLAAAHEDCTVWVMQAAQPR